MTGAATLGRIALPIAFCTALLCSSLASAGRWGADTLANDDALDLLAQVVPNGGAESIRSALDAALAAASPLDDERASRALAAAELVAAMVGKPSSNLPARGKEWAALHSKDANKDLVQSAVKAVDRIVRDSETLELMHEGGAKDLQEWQASVTNLQARLVTR